MNRRKESEPNDSELSEVVQQLTAELRVLREVIDELREEVQWRNHNYPENAGVLKGRRISSCSLDPTDPNFTVNSVDEETMELLRSEGTSKKSKRPSTATTPPGKLFS